MNLNERLKVEWVNGTSSNCFHVTASRVTCMWPLKDEQVLAAVAMAGLAGGQMVKITGHSTRQVPDPKYTNYFHEFHVYDVVCECDSGD